MFYCNSSDKKGESGTIEIPIVEENKVTVADGESTGEYRMKDGEEGLILLRWSNMHSWWNSNKLSYSIDVVDIPK